MRLLLMAALLGVPAAPSTGQEFDCVMEPALVVRLGSPMPGLLAEVTLQRGSEVTAGAIIGRLHSEVEEVTIELLAEQAASNAEVEAQEARLDLSLARLDRNKRLAERGITTREQLEEVAAETEVVRRELAMALLRQRLAALELQRARRALDQRVIRSPIDGIVIERVLSAGEFVAQDGHVALIASLDPLHVEAFLPVHVFPQVHEGQRALVRPAPPVGGAFEARVSIIDRVFDAASATFGMRLILDNPDGSLPAGHRCTVEFLSP